MEKRLFRWTSGILLLGAGAVLAVLPACGGSSDGPEPVPTTVLTTPATTEPITETPTPAPAATAVPSTGSSADSSAGGPPDQAELLAQGKLIFEKTAGGVGCAFCHGMDGKGNGPSGMGAPANRGADRDKFEWALGGGETDAMTFIELTKDEKTAVLAYLDYLAVQP